MEDIAIVILNWNGRNYLEQFLPDVVRYSENARIIVADNASTDGSVSFLKEHYPSIQIIHNKSNEGFAKGYNDALKKVISKYYLLLNSDVQVTEGWLLPLANIMEDENIAGCQPKILSYHQKDFFEHAGASGGYLDTNYFPFCRGRIFDKVEKDNGQYDNATEIFWGSGACLLIRSDLFHNVGGFDEDFFAHMEEIDLCWRIKKLNYRFMVVPESKVYHVGGGTLPYSSPQKVYLNFRNNLMMVVKNHEGLLFIKLFYRLTLDGIAAMRFLFTGNFRNFYAVFRAHIAHHINLRKTLKKRKEIKRTTIKFNPAGLYNGNILWAFYFKGVKEFSKLNQRLFSDLKK